MWFVWSILIFLLFCDDAVRVWIMAKADEIRAKAEKIRHDISREQNEQNEQNDKR